MYKAQLFALDIIRSQLLFMYLFIHTQNRFSVLMFSNSFIVGSVQYVRTCVETETSQLAVIRLIVESMSDSAMVSPLASLASYLPLWG